MKDTAGNGRLQRGIALANAGAATLHGDLWVVQGTDRNWTVNLDGQYGPTCNCPDYQNRMKDQGGQCAHIVCAQITDSRKAAPVLARQKGQDMPDMPDGFEVYRMTEPERCDLCRKADDEMLLFDGFDPEDPGTGVLVCSECQSWGYRVLMFAENDPDLG